MRAYPCGSFADSDSCGSGCSAVPLYRLGIRPGVRRTAQAEAPLNL